MTVFDIIGPIMIGPSSSHTAGAVRLGKIAGALLGEPTVQADIVLHGSFAKTYKGHGTDKALIAGIMGMLPCDPRIRNSPELAQQQGLQVTFQTETLGSSHPNTAFLTLKAASGKKITMQGSSVGGGNIVVTQINGMSVELSGQYTTLIVLHKDTPGTIAAVTNFMAGSGINIANFRLSRTQKGGTAIMCIEIDGDSGQELNEHIQTLPNIISSTILRVE